MAKLEAGVGPDDHQWLPDLLRLGELGGITATGPTQFVYANDPVNRPITWADVAAQPWRRAGPNPYPPTAARPSANGGSAKP